MSGQIIPSTVLHQLAAHLARPVDEATQARARLHLIDWIGCTQAGSAERAGRILRSLRADGAGGDVFCWGGLGNVLEMDDVDKRALLHPGPSIMPAALVCAELVDASGDQLLSAIVRGYEATVRLGRAVGPNHYAFWHNTGTCGPIGAAAACASLHGLDETTTAHALALAMSQATGLWQTRHEPTSMGKQLHTAHAARAGFDAARLAQAGFNGPLSILEGEQGFFAATCSGASPADVLAPYDSEWLIHDVSFKPWPACRHAHPVIDATLELAERIGEMPSGEDIEVVTYGDALKFCDRAMPASSIEAKFSLQHAVAVCLARGGPTLEDFSPDSITDPELSAIRARVNVAVGEPYASAYPARFGAAVSCGGHTVAMPDALGDPENPVTTQQVEAKARMLMVAGGLDELQAEAMIRKVQKLANGAAAAPVIEALRKGLS